MEVFDANVLMQLVIESSRDICRLGAELAVQSQQRRWDDGYTRHSQLQPALSSAGTDRWVVVEENSIVMSAEPTLAC